MAAANKGKAKIKDNRLIPLVPKGCSLKKGTKVWVYSGSTSDGEEDEDSSDDDDDDDEKEVRYVPPCVCRTNRTSSELRRCVWTQDVNVWDGTNHKYPGSGVVAGVFLTSSVESGEYMAALSHQDNGIPVQLVGSIPVISPLPINARIPFGGSKYHVITDRHGGGSQGDDGEDESSSSSSSSSDKETVEEVSKRPRPPMKNGLFGNSKKPSATGSIFGIAYRSLIKNFLYREPGFESPEASAKRHGWYSRGNTEGPADLGDIPVKSATDSTPLFLYHPTTIVVKELKADQEQDSMRFRLEFPEFREIVDTAISSELGVSLSLLPANGDSTAIFESPEDAKEGLAFFNQNGLASTPLFYLENAIYNRHYRDSGLRDFLAAVLGINMPILKLDLASLRNLKNPIRLNQQGCEEAFLPGDGSAPDLDSAFEGLVDTRYTQSSKKKAFFNAEETKVVDRDLDVYKVLHGKGLGSVLRENLFVKISPISRISGSTDSYGDWDNSVFTNDGDTPRGYETVMSALQSECRREEVYRLDFGSGTSIRTGE
jgi:hypothetical protein